MGRPARSLHDAGNHRTFERRSHRQAARRSGGLTIPASPAGERETTAALTPLLGARSLSVAPGDEEGGCCTLELGGSGGLGCGGDAVAFACPWAGALLDARD